ncbi:trehalose-phosphatase [Acinetobacter sp.]|uniref:trehalose-phosphatase n=2 Tax=Acinetobacter sp. TaxID=472 RepID=UPI002649453E|nr:trehalose-phosphatase [Acinetobacter sp.]MDN5524146.1 trehalose-phosphatase [Acinetobacter sp.]
MYTPSSYYPDERYYSKNLLQLITSYLNADKKICLFLDIDGTLSEFHPDPSRSFIPKTTLKTLQQINNFNVVVSFVTGRSVQIAERLIAPLEMPIAGTHGLEIKMNHEVQLNTAAEEFDLSLIQQEIQQLCRPYPQLLIENKTYSVALHYRQCPELADIARQIAEDVQHRHAGLKINEGKFVFELLPLQADKGKAIEIILKHLNFSDVLPIFIGDDRTDESGFKIINHYNGISIKVGPESTHAHYRLKNVSDVANFLNLFSQFLKARFLGLSQVSNGEKACLD